MLDDNLPTFFLKNSSTGVQHHRELYHSHHGSDPAPAYILQYADPSSPSPQHKNCYATALFDAYNPEVLFGEVLARPAWSQPTLSQEDIRRQGGVPPPPTPSLPTTFDVQLYNPDLQVKVETKSKWSSSDSYEFSIPEEVFRAPSSSILDRSQSDPASLHITPRLNFVWRKEGKFSKDLTCYMVGRSTDPKKKSSRKDPDIAIALWRSMRELTIYEPNLSRVDMEDPKGLEVVLLLSAIVIKDLYFSSKEQWTELFNITDSGRKLSSGGRKLSNPNRPISALAPSNSTTPSISNEAKRNSLPKLQTTPPGNPSRPPPLADPRAQWELEAETARLKAQEQAASRDRDRRRREREKADEAERKRLQRMVEEEEKAARRKQAEIDKETERLRKLYSVTPIPERPVQANSSRPQQPPRPSVGSNGLAQPGGSSLGVPQRPAKKKSSFFGLRGVSDEGPPRTLAKKQSSMW